jgi:hypothetical protein
LVGACYVRNPSGRGGRDRHLKFYEPRVAALSERERIALVSRALYDLERLCREVRAVGELLCTLLGVSAGQVDAIIDRAERDDSAAADSAD